MATFTTRLGLRQPGLTDQDDVPADLAQVTGILDDAAIDAGFGAYAGLPPAGVDGRYYWANDVKQLFRDNGATWEVVGSQPVPAGSVSMFAGTAAPAGYLMADGADVSRTTYAALFAAIGTTYGAGNGTTTFRLPDLRGRVPVGVDGAANRLANNDTLGASGGEEVHVLIINELPIHNHGGWTGGSDRSLAHSHTIDTRDYDFGSSPGGGLANIAAGAANMTFRDNGGGTDDGFTPDHFHAIPWQGANWGHNNMQPFQVVNFIIKT